MVARQALWWLVEYLLLSIAMHIGSVANEHIDGGYMLSQYDTGTNRKYLFIAEQRCGGTWITSTIAETLNPHGAFLKGEIINYDDVSKGSEIVKEKILAKVLHNPSCVDAKLCGFRIPYFVWRTIDFVSLAKEEQMSVVYIERENKFNLALSIAVGNALKSMQLATEDIMHCKAGKRCYANEVKVVMDIPFTLELMRKKQREDSEVHQALKDSGLNWHYFGYEDVMAEGFGSMLAFLGVNSSVISNMATSGYEKRVSRPQADMVSNYAEVVAALRDTEFRWQLDWCIEHIGHSDHC